MGNKHSRADSTITITTYTQHDRKESANNNASNNSQHSPSTPVVAEESEQHTPRGVLSLMTMNPEVVPNVICKDVPIQVYVYDVHDGDTVHFLMAGGPDVCPVIKLSLRLLGIDTPEIRGGAGHLVEEKIAGEMARDRLAELIGVRAVKATSQAKPRKQTLTTIIIRDWDKFGGRILGEIILPDGRSAVDIMCSEGYGRVYHGEKKTPWTLEDLSKAPFKLI